MDNKNENKIENINVNGGFPPIDIIDNKKKTVDIKKERAFTDTNVNILNIISSKKKEFLKKKEELIDVVDDF